MSSKTREVITCFVGTLSSARKHALAGLLAFSALISASGLCRPVSAAPGDLDPSFGSSGKVITTFPGQLEGLGGAYAVALQPDGKIVAAGWSFSSSPGGHGQFALARYNPDGSLGPL